MGLRGRRSTRRSNSGTFQPVKSAPFLLALWAVTALGCDKRNQAQPDQAGEVAEVPPKPQPEPIDCAGEALVASHQLAFINGSHYAASLERTQHCARIRFLNLVTGEFEGMRELGSHPNPNMSQVLNITLDHRLTPAQDLVRVTLDRQVEADGKRFTLDTEGDFEFISVPDGKPILSKASLKEAAGDLPLFKENAERIARFEGAFYFGTSDGYHHRFDPKDQTFTKLEPDALQGTPLTCTDGRCSQPYCPPEAEFDGRACNPGTCRPDPYELPLESQRRFDAEGEPRLKIGAKPTLSEETFLEPRIMGKPQCGPIPSPFPLLVLDQQTLENDAKGRLTRLNPETYAVEWSVDLPFPARRWAALKGEFNTTVLVTGGLVAFYADGSTAHLRRIDLDTGKTEWSLELPR